MGNILVWNAFRGKIYSALCLDEANEQALKGNNVYLLDCDESIGGCYFNRIFDPIKCKSCIFIDKMQRINKISPLIKILKAKDVLKDIEPDKQPVEFNYASFDDLKKITYKGVNIGMGVVSSYIDYTRSSDPELDSNLKKYINRHLSQAVIITEMLLYAIKTYSIEKVIFCNGRLSQLKPALDISRSLNLDFISVEIDGQTRKTIVKDYRNNTTQFDALAFKEACENKWNNSSLDESDKIKIGSTFFINRRNKKLAGDKIYTSNQEKSLMPSGWNNKVENIVIFNSSEDEFAALGGDYTSKRIYKNQIDGIVDIVSHYENDKSKHFYLRIHPNLIGIKEAYHQDLYSLNYDNLTVIPADSPIDTYSLMDNADKIIVFGSTTGIEGSYAKKPVISLGYSLYYYFDIVYLPHDTAELWGYIDNRELLAKFNESIYKYGYFIMADDGEKTRFIDTQFQSVRFNKKTIKIHRFQKILGNHILPIIINQGFKYISKIMKKYEFNDIPVNQHAN